MSNLEAMEQVVTRPGKEGVPVEAAGVVGSGAEAAPSVMDTDNKGDPSSGNTEEGEAKMDTRNPTDAGEGSASGGEPKQNDTSDSGEAAGKDGEKAEEGADGEEKDTVMPDDYLPKIDIVMCFGRCQDCTLKACKKMRSEITKTDLLLCGECLEIHLNTGAPGETKLDINEKVNQEDSEEYPREKRVPWECKNRPNYTLAVSMKYN
jgi:hypothetical protein